MAPRSEDDRSWGIGDDDEGGGLRSRLPELPSLSRPHRYRPGGRWGTRARPSFLAYVISAGLLAVIIGLICVADIAFGPSHHTASSASTAPLPPVSFEPPQTLALGQAATVEVLTRNLSTPTDVTLAVQSEAPASTGLVVTYRVCATNLAVPAVSVAGDLTLQTTAGAPEIDNLLQPGPDTTAQPHGCADSTATFDRSGANRVTSVKYSGVETITWNVP